MQILTKTTFIALWKSEKKIRQETLVQRKVLHDDCSHSPRKYNSVLMYFMTFLQSIQNKNGKEYKKQVFLKNIDLLK
jgi:hypothetical protein